MFFVNWCLNYQSPGSFFLPSLEEFLVFQVFPARSRDQSKGYMGKGRLASAAWCPSKPVMHEKFFVQPIGAILLRSSWSRAENPNYSRLFLLNNSLYSPWMVHIMTMYSNFKLVTQSPKLRWCVWSVVRGSRDRRSRKYFNWCTWRLGSFAPFLISSKATFLSTVLWLFSLFPGVKYRNYSKYCRGARFRK